MKNAKVLELLRCLSSIEMNRFEKYLAAPQTHSQKKGRFNAETCASLYSRLAETLMQLHLPTEAEEARRNAIRQSSPGPVPR